MSHDHSHNCMPHCMHKLRENVNGAPVKVDRYDMSENI